jgi:hypothetical protein
MNTLPAFKLSDFENFKGPVLPQADPEKFREGHMFLLERYKVDRAPDETYIMRDGVWVRVADRPGLMDPAFAAKILATQDQMMELIRKLKGMCEHRDEIIKLVKESLDQLRDDLPKEFDGHGHVDQSDGDWAEDPGHYTNEVYKKGVADVCNQMLDALKDVG